MGTSMNSGFSARLNSIIHPAILLFTGSLTGLTLGFVLLPRILEYDLVNKGATVSWETLAAGFLGLVGGSFAFLAAHKQIQSNRDMEEERRKRLANASRMKLIGILDALSDFCMDQRSIIKTISDNVLDVDNAQSPEFSKLEKEMLGDLIAATQHETDEIQDSLQKVLINLRQYHEEIQSLSAKIERHRNRTPAKMRPFLAPVYERELNSAKFSLIEADVFIARCFEIINAQAEVKYELTEISEQAYVSSAIKLTGQSEAEAQKHFKSRLRNISASHKTRKG